MKKRIIITTQFSALHHWPDCNIEEVRYLQHLHRHLFHVTLKFNISHNDRESEFIVLKNEITKQIQLRWEGKNIGARSCEDIAEEFLEQYNADYVSVLEDGENGAEIQR